MMSLTEALKLMEKPERFDISFVKLSTGEIVRLEGVILAKYMNVQEKQRKKATVSHSRTVDHFKDSTRLLYIMSSGQLRECKIRLITMFNSQPVFY